jgi:CHAT domain-containing protein
MGASEFEEQASLPGVPIEVNTITSTLEGDAFINDLFTLNYYKEQRSQAPYRIVHFATHADFQAGFPDESYIQFWDTRLTLNKLNQLGWKWNDPPTDLFVLSACRTAIGDKNAELGFAGLAVQAGVPSALASLWYVSDQGTLALMLKFYEKLQQIPIKAEALRQTQLALLRGEIQIQSGELRGYTSRGNVELPPELSQNDLTFSHPVYWAGFTMIGSPW